MMLRTVMLLVILTLSLSLKGQVAGRVYDAKTGAALAFVNVVVEGVQAGTMSDIDGRFAVASAREGEKLIFSYVGYKRLTVDVPSDAEARKQLRIRIEAEPVKLDEAIVLPGVNPAERIMRRVIGEKDNNNPERCCAFTYDSYNKLVFTGLIDSTLAGNPEKIAELDTNSRSAFDFFEKQHLLLMESVSERRFIPPSLSSEEVKASRFSGLSNPDFVLLGTQLQSFSFYEDEISLLDYRYLSPLHDGAIRRYLFIIEDTTYHEADTVFILSYRPRKGKNFKGMKGLLYINTNGYALESVIAEPAEGNPGGMEIRIRQQYAFIDKRQWFPVQLNTDILFRNMFVGPFEMIGIGRSYLKNIRLDPPLRRRDVGTIALRMDPLSTRQPDDFWAQQRFDSLDAREARTYVHMDSLSKEHNFERKYNWLQTLSDGRVNLGLIDVDLTRLMRFNDYEGFRLGGGLYTSDRLVKNLSLGGYAAYGFGDRAMKWGGELIWKAHPRTGTEFRAMLYDDVFERGGQLFPDAGGWLTDKNFYQFFLNRMDRLNVAEVSFKTRLPWYTTVSAAYRNGVLQHMSDYTYLVQTIEGPASVTAFADRMNIQEVDLALRWSHREVLYQTTRRLLQAGTKNPVVAAYVTIGEVQPAGEAVNYLRTGASVEHTVRMPTLGNFSFFAHAAKVYGEAPAFRLMNFRASGAMWTVSTPYAFETMQPGRHIADEYAAIHLRHSFKDLLFRKGKFRPHLVMVHNMAIGRLSNAERHSNLGATAPEHGHVESGLEVQHIVRSSMTGIGLGAFYRYGAANTGDFSEDFVVKVTVGFAF